MSALRGLLFAFMVLVGVFYIAQGIGFQFWGWAIDITVVTVGLLGFGLLLIGTALEYVTRP